jgi:hypothetical protein
VGDKTSQKWEGEGNDENEPRPKSGIVFVTYHLGLPYPGSPLVFLSPPLFRRANLSRPHPCEKGRGECSGVGVSGQVQVLELEPTSLKGGEGLISGLQRVVEGEMGGER